MLSEEEANLLQQENQALRKRADLLEETISLLREQIGLKDLLIAASQRETMLLTQQVQEREDQLKNDSYRGPCHLLRYDSLVHRRACRRKVARNVGDFPESEHA